MAEFELLRNVTVGQYIPTESVVHRLDPRAKLLATLLLSAAIMSAQPILACLFMLAVMLGIAALARIPLGYLLSGLKPVIGFLFFVSIFQLLFNTRPDANPRVLFEWQFIRITQFGIQIVITNVIRVACFIFLVSLLTMTTKTTQLAHAIEMLLHPFRRFGVPAHELALIVTIALRFVPTLAEELETVMKAQASRGGEFGTSRWTRPDKMARARLPLIVPLFVSAFRRAEDLVLAMEARGYVGGAGRTSFVQYRATPLDFAVVVAAGVLAVALPRIPWPAVSQLRNLFST